MTTTKQLKGTADNILLNSEKKVDFSNMCMYSYGITFRVTEGYEPLLSLLNKARLPQAS